MTEPQCQQNFEEKWKEYTVSVHSHMIIFDVERQCGISSLITIYRQETLTDLYNKIKYHFNTIFHELSINTSTNGMVIVFPSIQTIGDFINQYNIKNNITIDTLYGQKMPVIYKLYLHDDCPCFFCDTS